MHAYIIFIHTLLAGCLAIVQQPGSCSQEVHASTSSVRGTVEIMRDYSSELTPCLSTGSVVLRLVLSRLAGVARGIRGSHCFLTCVVQVQYICKSP